MTKSRGFGKRKGSAFERQICKSLSLWVTNGKRSDCFWRSAMSGGRATVAFKNTNEILRVAGDICATAPEGFELCERYYFELKHYRNIGLESFFLYNKGPIAGWWKETKRQAAKYSREPVLIAKGNNIPILIVTQRILSFNPYPVAHLSNCSIGLFNRTMRTKYHVGD